MRIFIVASALFLLLNGFLQSQGLIWKEADVFTKDGIKFTKRVIVKFNSEVASLPRGKAEVKISEFKPDFFSLKELLLKLEQRYGEIKITRRYPDAVWGDTIRFARGTGKVVFVPDFSQIYNIDFPEPVPFDLIAPEFKKLPFVSYVDEPPAVMLCSDPNYTLYPRPGQWNLRRVDASKTWDITKGDPNIEIAIVDDFVGYGAENHIDLRDKQSNRGQLLYGGHGRMVAGFACATTNNITLIASLGWNLKYQSWDYHDWDNIRRATDAGARVINCSWVTKVYSQYLADLILYALRQNVIVVAAVGNRVYNYDSLKSYPFIPYPAAYAFGDTQVIAVSATDSLDRFPSLPDGYPTWNFSIGDDPVNDPIRSFTDVAAPGWREWKTYPLYYLHPDVIDIVDSIDSGTSFSAPMVSALAGLLLSVDSTLTPVQVYRAIISSTDKVGQYAYNPVGWNGLTWNKYLGYGRINAYKALRTVIPSAPQNLTIVNPNQNGQHPILRWNRNPESKLITYNIYRGYYTDSGGGDLSVSNVGIMAPPGSYVVERIATNYPDTVFIDYEVTIRNSNPRRWYDYWVKAVGISGKESPASNYVGVWGSPIIRADSTATDMEKEVIEPIPEKFELFQNYPNPFNSGTIIKFALPEDSYVKINVYDALGRLIAVPLNGDLKAGYHYIKFDASDLTSGIYFYEIIAGSFKDVKKMVVIK